MDLHYGSICGFRGKDVNPVDDHGSHMTEGFLWECYENNIFVLYLPLHALHVLQLLEVAVFGPLEHAYRRYIFDLASIADSSNIGKISFLYNYHKSRREATTKNNACAGFKAAGLWPVDPAKVLMNPMVTQTPVLPVTPISPVKEKSSCHFKRPGSSMQVRKVLGDFPAGDINDHTVRLLFRKVGGQLDHHLFQIEAQNRKISLLRHENEEIRPKRRRKVTFNGNTEFAMIESIKNAREKMWKVLQLLTTTRKSNE